jgi:large subunit ribosomal protein L15
MNVGSIPAVRGARHRRKRVGRGIGSGHGKTSTRGQKGQRARTGEGKRPGFEGGRNPLIRRLPKRGFRFKATGRPRLTEIVNLRDLNGCREGERVTPDRLEELRLIRDAASHVKLLGDGKLVKRLTIVVHRASEPAKAKVAKAGGTVELIDNQGSTPRPASPQPHAA